MASVVEVLVRPHLYLKKHGVRGFAARLVMRPLAPLAARRVRSLDKRVFDSVPILREDQGLTIGFSPYVPHVTGYQITKVCKALSLRIVEGSGDISMFWHDTTVAPHSPKGAINWRCRDISKAKVGEVFDGVFPYSLTVDPETYSGKCVEKVDENGLHVASIVECPRPRKAGYAYQRLIDNSVGNDVLDLRAVIVGSEIPVVYAKRRPIHDRFSNMNKSVALAINPFSPDEVGLIRAFCSEMGLDYGEIDVLRDGRIYIVDVNKTTFGPPNHLPMKQRLEAIELIARAFERQFLMPMKRQRAYRCAGCGCEFINEVSEAETDETFARQFPHTSKEERADLCEECMVELIIALRNDPEAMKDPETRAFVLSLS